VWARHTPWESLKQFSVPKSDGHCRHCSHCTASRVGILWESTAAPRGAQSRHRALLVAIFLRNPGVSPHAINVRVPVTGLTSDTSLNIEWFLCFQTTRQTRLPFGLPRWQLIPHSFFIGTVAILQFCSCSKWVALCFCNTDDDAQVNCPLPFTGNTTQVPLSTNGRCDVHRTGRVAPWAFAAGYVDLRHLTQ